MVRGLWSLLILIVLGRGPAEAQELARHALLIGNQRYERAVGPLVNPHKDVALVDKALAQIGFKNTLVKHDASRDEMLFAVHDLAMRLRGAGRGAIGFLYYTGHGVAVGGENVLVPVNVAGTGDAELRVRGVRLSDVVDILKQEAPDSVLFIVLDACRNNIGGSRGAKGFAPVNEQRTGVVIAFATAQGATASDEGAASGPYAAALAEEIVKPGRTDQAVFNEVRRRVAQETNNRQIPWTHDGLVGERVVFSAGAVAPRPSSEALQAWDRAKDSRSTAVMEAFAKQFKGTFYAELARERQKELAEAQRQQKAESARKTATVAKPPGPAGSPPRTSAAPSGVQASRQPSLADEDAFADLFKQFDNNATFAADGEPLQGQRPVVLATTTSLPDGQASRKASWRLADEEAEGARKTATNEKPTGPAGPPPRTSTAPPAAQASRHPSSADKGAAADFSEPQGSRTLREPVSLPGIVIAPTPLASAAPPRDLMPWITVPRDLPPRDRAAPARFPELLQPVILAPGLVIVAPQSDTSSWFTPPRRFEWVTRGGARR